MNVILYMATSINGLIAGEGDDTSWVSTEDFEGQAKVAKRAGNIIYGKRTYDIGIQENSVPVPDCLNVVMTHEANTLEPKEHFLFTDKKPQEVLNLLEQKGFKEVLIAGGSQINKTFLEKNLVDEIYIDVEPVLIGKGLPLFSPTDFANELEFLGSEMISKKTIQLHYKVKK